MLELIDVTAGYGSQIVLHGVSLRVATGGITALLGPNGAGKSTLLKTVLGLIPNQKRTGTILYHDQALDGRATERIVALGIAYVPEGREIFNELSVAENLQVGAWLRRDSQALKRNLARTYDLFPRLAERRQQAGGSLSGGEQQMLAMGRALMNSPDLILLDEPSLGLAPLWIDEVFRIIAAIASQGVSVMLVEQNATRSLELADFGYVLENGRVVLAGSAASLRDHQGLRQAYLGISAVPTLLEHV